ncbi:OmpA family protein [Erythrobacter sp. MTPC3]|uniref:OmpA family protein n=1 Tax=Erythrobacter sp. MTPC3 TaxID=3056564 RepID=UPI0036F26660
MRKHSIFTTLPITVAACAALAACGGREDANLPADDTVDTAATPSPDAPVSIIRPDVEQPETPEEPLKELRLTVSFPDGGSDLDDAAISTLQELLASEQAALGLPITLRAHSDAGGRDEVNMRASRSRGDSVAAWLVENGIAEDRLEIIAFGEQNPVEPNALPDGEPNEAGRAANRRVEIYVPTLSLGDSSEDEPESAEASD